MGEGGGGGGGAVDERYVTQRLALGGVPSSVTKRYKGVGGVKLSGNKRYVTLEWPLGLDLWHIYIYIYIYICRMPHSWPSLS